MNTLYVFVVFLVYDVYEVLVGANLQLLPTVYTHPPLLPLFHFTELSQRAAVFVVPIEPRCGSTVISGL